MSEKTVRTITVSLVVIIVVISIAYLIHISTEAALALGAAGAASAAAAAASRRRKVGVEAAQARSQIDRVEDTLLEVDDLVATARERALEGLDGLSPAEKAYLGDSVLSSSEDER
jgi:hypothetical protein